MINILILSAGTRDKVVQYFKEALAGKGKVIATDCSPYAPAIYEADEYVLVPRITEPGYLDKILEICREKQITGVLSLIDPELSLLADNKERFLEVGTVPIVPDAKQVHAVQTGGAQVVPPITQVAVHRASAVGMYMSVPNSLIMSHEVHPFLSVCVCCSF